MTKKENRQQRRDRQDRELEENQDELRESITRTQTIIDQTGQIMKRHQRESDDADD